MSDATLDFHRLGRVQVHFHDVSIVTGVASHVLTFTTNTHADWLEPSRAESMAQCLVGGSLWLNSAGFRWVGGVRPTVWTLRRYPVSTDLDVAVSDDQLAGLDQLRPDADLRFTIKLEMTLLAPPEGVFAVQEKDVSYTLRGNRWHELLERVGNEIAITVRVPTPLDDPSRVAEGEPSLFVVGQRLRQARVQFHNQQWETSVGTCRQALEALGQLHPMPTTKTIDVMPRRQRNQEQRWAAIYDDVMSLTSVAHHQDSLTAGFVWTRADAQAALATTAAIVARYVAL